MIEREKEGTREKEEWREEKGQRERGRSMDFLCV